MFSNFLASHRRSSQTPSLPSQGGFGLVELMVSITIITIVAAIILTRQSAFNSAVLLRGQTFEIALAVREVQLSAVSSTGDGAGNFREAHGIHFSTDSAENGYYTIFIDGDTPLDGYTDSAEKFGLQGLIDGRFEIRDIQVDGTSLTAPDNSISVVFERPNFDAMFFDSDGNLITPPPVVNIVIGRRGAVTNSDPIHNNGVVRTLEITSTGQISLVDI